MTDILYVHTRASLDRDEFVRNLGAIVGEAAICLAEGWRFRVLRLSEEALTDADGLADLDDAYRLTVFGDGKQARWVRRQDRSGQGDAAWLGRSDVPTWPVHSTLSVAHVEHRRGILWGTAAESIGAGWTRFAEWNIGHLDLPVDASPGSHAVATWDVLYEADEETGLLRSVATLYRSLDTATPDQLRYTFGRISKEGT